MTAAEGTKRVRRGRGRSCGVCLCEGPAPRGVTRFFLFTIFTLNIPLCGSWFLPLFQSRGEGRERRLIPRARVVALASLSLSLSRFFLSALSLCFAQVKNSKSSRRKSSFQTTAQLQNYHRALTAGRRRMAKEESIEKSPFFIESAAWCIFLKPIFFAVMNIAAAN